MNAGTAAPRTAPGAARCTVGLLTLNGESDAADCAASVLAQTEPDLDIRWIDNGSSDRTIESVLEGHPGFVRPERLGENIGFCGGHNMAFAAADAPYYLALNQDAVLAPDYVERLCDRMDRDDSISAISGIILSGSPSQAGPWPVLSAGMALSRGRFPYELGAGTEYRPPVGPGNDAPYVRFVPAVTGAALMIRRAHVPLLPPGDGTLFPEEFFAYFEEVDLALRIARAGFRCAVDPAALAWHRARGREGRGRTEIRAHYLRNHWLLSLRHDSPTEFLADLPRIIGGELRHYLPRYAGDPAATLRALALLPRAIGPTSRFRRDARALARNRDDGAAAGDGRARFYRESVRLLRGGVVPN